LEDAQLEGTLGTKAEAKAFVRANYPLKKDGR
jgi:hypothetical protein